MMKKIGLYFIFFILLWGLYGCASQRSDGRIADRTADLTTGKWFLVSVRKDVQGTFVFPQSDHIPTLQVEMDGKYNGYDGCNSFYGNCTFYKDSITFDSAITTLKACLDNQSIDDYLRTALKQVTNYSIEGNQLILKKHLEPLIVYKR